MNLPVETMREILLRSNGKTVMRYCQTSTIAQLLCQDEQFWKEKFELYNLYFPLVWEDNDNYSDMFDLLRNNINNVKIVLKINEIEKNRIYEQTKGIILIVIEDMDEDNLEDLLNYKFERGKSGIINFNEIKIQLTNKGYLVGLTKNQGDVNLGYKSSKDVERIFSYALSTSGICHDDKGITFFSMDDPAFEEMRINDYYTNDIDVVRAGIRRGLWEGMDNKIKMVCY